MDFRPQRAVPEPPRQLSRGELAVAVLHLPLALQLGLWAYHALQQFLSRPDQGILGIFLLIACIGSVLTAISLFLKESFFARVAHAFTVLALIAAALLTVVYSLWTAAKPSDTLRWQDALLAWPYLALAALTALSAPVIRRKVS
jgi:hypothetical protein